MRVVTALLLVLFLVSDGDAKRIKATWTIPKVQITAYAHGQITASGKKARSGMVAVSKDLEKRLGLKFGDRVYISGVGTFTFWDRMPSYHRRTIDVYMPSVKKAVKFGRKVRTLTITKEF